MAVGEDSRAGGEWDSAGIDGQPLLGRFEAATLLAVEAANGGEWAGLGQVIVTFKVVFGQFPDGDQFTDSCQLLCEARLIEYLDEGLTLTSHGRKLLRQAGSRRSSERPQNVTDLLNTIEDRDLAAPGSVAEPDEAEVAAAFETLTDEVTDDLMQIQASNETRMGPRTLWIGNIGRRSDLLLPDLPIDDTGDADDPSEPRWHQP
jgi:hypothetical protein